MSIYDTDLDHYCPLRTDLNGEMRKCVKGCAWWHNGSCAVTRISMHIKDLKGLTEDSGIAVDQLGDTMQDVISEFNSSVRQTADRLQEAVESTKEVEN